MVMRMRLVDAQLKLGTVPQDSTTAAAVHSASSSTACGWHNDTGPRPQSDPIRGPTLLPTLTLDHDAKVPVLELLTISTDVSGPGLP